MEKRISRTQLCVCVRVTDGWTKKEEKQLCARRSEKKVECGSQQRCCLFAIRGKLNAISNFWGPYNSRVSSLCTVHTFIISANVKCVQQQQQQPNCPSRQSAPLQTKTINEFIKDKKKKKKSCCIFVIIGSFSGIDIMLREVSSPPKCPDTLL